MSHSETQSLSGSGAPDSARVILRTALPMLASLLLEQLVGMTDAVFLGRYGEVELGASAIGGIVFLIVLMQGYGFSVGAQSLMARANGAGDREAVGVVFRQSAMTLVGLGLLLAAAMTAAAAPLMEAIILSPDVQRAAASYAWWRSLGLPFAYLCILIRAFYVAILSTRILAWSSGVTVAANCILNYLLIFGAGPFPEMGIAGAAIASALAEAACLAFLVLYMAVRHDAKRFGLALGLSAWRWQSAIQKRIFKLGRWLMLQEAIAFAVWLYFFSMTEHVSPRALAISNVVRQLGSLVFLFVHAFGSTCGSIAANLYGAKRFAPIDAVAKKGMLLSLACMLPFVALFAAAPSTTLGFFTDLPEVISEAKPALWVMLASYTATLPCFHYFSILGAMGFAKAAFRLSLAAAAVYAAYTAFITSATSNIALIWTADTVYGAVLGFGAWLVWRRGDWQETPAAKARPLHPQ